MDALRSRVGLAIVAVVGLVLAGCGGGAATEAGQTGNAGTESAVGEPAAGVSIVASTSILGDVVSNIAGEDADVEVLMEPGVDPHAFSPSAEQAQMLREADLVVVNGLQLEESLLDALDAAEGDGANVLRVAEELDPMPYEEGEEHADEEGEEHADEVGEGHADEEGEEHGAFDPHVWFDPERMADGATMIASSIAEVDDTLDDSEWETRGQAYADELLATDEAMTETLSAVPDDRRQLVTNHDAFGYFADRYDFEVIGTVIPGASTQVDTSAEEFGDLAEVVVDQDFPAIFSETTASDRLAAALAEETGQDVEIVQLYSGSLGEPGSGAETYIDLLLYDAQAIADALG